MVGTANRIEGHGGWERWSAFCNCSSGLVLNLIMTEEDMIENRCLSTHIIVRTINCWIVLD